MNFQVSDLLHQQHHLLESDISFILATKDLQLRLFTLLTVQQKEPFEAEKTPNRTFTSLFHAPLCKVTQGSHPELTHLPEQIQS